MTTRAGETRLTFFRNLQTFPLYKFDSLPPNNPPPGTDDTTTRLVFRLLTPTSFAFSLLFWRENVKRRFHEARSREPRQDAGERETE